MARFTPAILSAVLLAAQAQSPAGTPAVACARPDVPGATLHAADPRTPLIAQQQGISGSVVLIVALDAQSHLTGVTIQSSPSALLNQAAIDVARHTAFRAPVRGCLPAAGRFVFTVDFDEVDRALPTAMVGTPDAPAVRASGQGTTSEPADMAYVHAVFVTRDADRAAAIVANDAALAAFRARLAAPEALVTGYYDVLEEVAAPASPGAQRYVASHEAIVAVAPLARVRDVVGAALGAGAASTTLRYSVRDAAHLYAAALVPAVVDAAAKAERFAALHERRLGDVIDTQPMFASADVDEPGLLVDVHTLADVPAPGPVTLRVRADVTFALRP